MDRTLLYEASLEWCPEFPRRATFGEAANQTTAASRPELINKLWEAGHSDGPGYYSVYSFPRGHSQKDSIPKIDTLFIDLDIPKVEGSYHPNQGGRLEDWRRDMSKLLVRARMVSRVVLDAGLEEHFRVSYSGHKGIHLYIDFEPLNPELGEITKYKNGIAAYADELIDFLADEAGVDLHRWVDVNSHDLGRLARHPNTPHHGARHVDWTPYCVAGSIKELATMDPDDYLAVTKQPRPLVGTGRVPSERARRVITENVKSATSSELRSPGESQERNNERLEEYRDNSNDNIDVATVKNLLIKNKPCISEWIERDDAYDHGSSSRVMEINIIKELSKHEVPIDVIVEFFSDIPGFDEEYTRSLVKDIIARYYPSAFVCQNIVSDAPQFCLEGQCHIYSRADDLQID